MLLLCCISVQSCAANKSTVFCFVVFFFTYSIFPTGFIFLPFGISGRFQLLLSNFQQRGLGETTVLVYIFSIFRLIVAKQQRRSSSLQLLTQLMWATPQIMALSLYKDTWICNLYTQHPPQIKTSPPRGPFDLCRQETISVCCVFCSPGEVCLWARSVCKWVSDLIRSDGNRIPCRPSWFLMSRWGTSNWCYEKNVESRAN